MLRIPPIGAITAPGGRNTSGEVRANAGLAVIQARLK
jgi:hypothetical protein